MKDRWYIDPNENKWIDDATSQVKETLRQQGLSYGQAIKVLEATSNDLKAKAMNEKLKKTDIDRPFGESGRNITRPDLPPL